MTEDDYIRLMLLINDLKRNISNGNIIIEDSGLRSEFKNDIDYFYEKFKNK